MRDLYWNHRSILSQEEISNLESIMDTPLPSFHNIFEHKKLKPLEETSDFTIYHMTGTITPYSVVDISVEDYIAAINNNTTIKIELTDTNMTLELFFTPDDFWDFSEQRLITHIDI